MEWVAGATDKELRDSDGRETVSAPERRSRRIRSDDRAKRGKGVGGRRLSAPGKRERSERLIHRGGDFA